MGWKYKKVIPSPIENAVVEVMTCEELNLEKYKVTPNDGYVLHDSTLDKYGEDGACIPFFCKSHTTCSIGYDFSDVESKVYEYVSQSEGAVAVSVTAAGEREFYTVSKDIVDEKFLY